MMIEEKKQYFKELLTRWLEERLTVEKNSIRGFAERKDKSADFLDRASVESAADFSLRLKERESRLMKKITRTLKKLDEENFGVCEKCGRRDIGGEIK